MNIPLLIPTTFASLPSEILIAIAFLCDTSTAVSLARVSRHCAQCAELRIWRDLKIQESNIVLFDEDGLDHEEMNERRSVRLVSRLRTVTEKGTDEKWRVVRSVDAHVYASTSDETLKLLRSVSRNITSLTLRRSSHNVFPGRFDIALMRLISTQTFSALRQLRIARLHIDFPHFLPVLIRQCPNLSTLEITLSCDSLADPDLDEELWFVGPQLPLVDIPTRLKSIHMQYHYSLLGIGHGEFGKPFLTLISLLDNSPLLTQLSLGLPVDPLIPVTDIGAAVGRLQGLRDFACTAYEFWRMGGVGPDVFTFPRDMGMKRLGLSCVSKSSILTRCSFSNLETVHLNLYGQDIIDRRGNYYDEELLTSWLVPSASAPHLPSLNPQKSAWLLSNPQINKIFIIHGFPGRDTLEKFSIMDALEEEDIVTVKIGSIVHGENEILVVRLLWQNIEDYGGPPEEYEADGLRRRRVLYPVLREPGFELPGCVCSQRRSYPEIAMFADWDGFSVPLEVMKQVRREGGDSVDWDRRGVEVGDDAWSVLMDWRAGSNCEFWLDCVVGT